jgi:hypothetical protein
MVTETREKPEIFAADEHLRSVFLEAFSKHGLKSGRHGWRTIKGWRNLSTHSIAPLLVAWMLEDITREKVKRFREWNELRNRYKIFLLFKGELPSRAVADRVAWLNVKDDKRVHFIVSKKESEKKFAERLILAFDSGEGDSHILDAWWEEDIFVLVAPTKKGFRKLRVSLEKLPVLQKYSKEKLSNYEIDEDGLFVYWPALDIHLGWDQFEQAVDKEAYLKARQQAEEFNKSYGAAIKTLRKKTRLRQSDVGGLTARQIGRIERGQCRATYKAISKLAKAHKMSISDYMGELSKLL